MIIRSMPGTSDDEGTAAANDTEYGLVAYAFTRDLDRALRVSDRLDEYLATKYVAIASPPCAPAMGLDG
jgi:succinate-semialdehyde dehydrogenase/glutarate-semialdehyde dehydrogenase